MDEIMKILTSEAIKPVKVNEDLEPTMMAGLKLERVLVFKNVYSFNVK